MDTPDTPAQAVARRKYVEACEDLAAAASQMRQNQVEYDRAYEAYIRAHGAAQQAGVVK